MDLTVWKFKAWIFWATKIKGGMETSSENDVSMGTLKHGKDWWP